MLEIRRKTGKKYSAEEKLRTVLHGPQGEDSRGVLYQCEGIPSNLYYRWTKVFPDAGKKQLTRDTKREAIPN